MIVIIAVLIIFGVAIYFIQFRDCQVLEIRDSVSNKLYGRWAADGASQFAIEFIHSVNQSPVRENFKIEDKMIKLLSVRFSSFGAGMQSSLEEGGSPGESLTLSRDGDAMLISGYTASFRELHYIVGTVSDHILHINGETVSLRELCGRNAHISIRIR